MSETWAASATLRAGINRTVDTLHIREVKWRSLRITAGRQFEGNGWIDVTRVGRILGHGLIETEGGGMSIKDI